MFEDLSGCWIVMSRDGKLFNIVVVFKPPGWGLGVRLTTPPRKKILLRNLERRPRPTQGCRADDDDDDDDGDVVFKGLLRTLLGGCVVSKSESSTGSD
jgi:hypothetical protein